MRPAIFHFRHRALALASGAVCIGLLTGACGSPSGTAIRPQSADRAIALAAKTSRQISSFSVSATISIRGQFPAGAGASALRATTVHLTERVRLQPSVLAAVTLAATEVGKRFAINEIITPRAIYVRLPRMGAPAGTKPWTRFILPRRAKSAMQRAFRHMMNGGNLGAAASPRALVKVLGRARHVHIVRNQRVAGMATTEYAGILPPLPITSLVPSGQIPSGLAPVNIRVSGPVKVWLDRQHQPRRVQLTVTAAKMRLTLLSTITSVNKPVSVTLPLASQVRTQRIGGLAGSSLPGF